MKRAVPIQSKEMPPDYIPGAQDFNVCSAVSYFSTRVGSIIGAGRLSFRVRDGSGRFPVAIFAVTLFCLLCWWWGGVWVGCGCVLWVSFRPVSASSLCALL